MALNEIHKNKCTHRDLKPENIMINSDGDIVLIDMGFDTEFDEAIKEHKF